MQHLQCICGARAHVRQCVLVKYAFWHAWSTSSFTTLSSHPAQLMASFPRLALTPPQPSPHPTTSARGMCSLKMQDDSGPAGNAKRVGASIDADGETFSVRLLCLPLLAVWVFVCVVRVFLRWSVCKRSMCRSIHPRHVQLREADVCNGFVNVMRIIELPCTAIYLCFVSSQHCTLCVMQRNKASLFNASVSVGRSLLAQSPYLDCLGR